MDNKRPSFSDALGRHATMTQNSDDNELCAGCVYHPPNLPRDAYPAADWAMLQTRQCSFDHVANSADCLATRKTSCSLVDMERLRAKK